MLAIFRTLSPLPEITRRMSVPRAIELPACLLETRALLDRAAKRDIAANEMLVRLWRHHKTDLSRFSPRFLHTLPVCSARKQKRRAPHRVLFNLLSGFGAKRCRVIIWTQFFGCLTDVSLMFISSPVSVLLREGP